jgi:valyl-tRNA synthetase
LSSTEFAKNAPAEVVAKDRQRLAELETEIRQLAAQIARVTALKHQ